MDTGPILAPEPQSTILPGNYRHLQHPQTLDRPTLFLGDLSQEPTAPRSRLLFVDSSEGHAPVPLITLHLGWADRNHPERDRMHEQVIEASEYLRN
jgi:hypothetical protein